MMKFFYISALILLSLSTSFAQKWNKEDSVWIQNYIEGKELKINEETLKAIKEGTLIAPSWMKDENGNFKKLIKDFEEASKLDSAYIERVDPLTMPPAVFALYVLYMDKVDSLNAEQTIMLSVDEKEKLGKIVPSDANQTISLMHSQIRGQTGVISGHDFNDILSTIFSPQYRQLKHNRKYATAYKNYYDEGAVRRTMQFTESEKRQLNRAVQNQRKVNIKVSPFKVGSIDD
jgi:hypothetical protein